jgi:hypothetical protein
MAIATGNIQDGSLLHTSEVRKFMHCTACGCWLCCTILASIRSQVKVALLDQEPLSGLTRYSLYLLPDAPGWTIKIVFGLCRVIALDWCEDRSQWRRTICCGAAFQRRELRHNGRCVHPRSWQSRRPTPTPAAPSPARMRPANRFPLLHHETHCLSTEKYSLPCPWRCFLSSKSWREINLADTFHLLFVISPTIFHNLTKLAGSCLNLSISYSFF